MRIGPRAKRAAAVVALVLVLPLASCRILNHEVDCASDADCAGFGTCVDGICQAVATALQEAGHAIDAVTYQPAQSGGKCVLTKGQAQEAFNYESELLRKFGYNV